MREAALVFGQHKSVVGIVTDPPAGTPSNGLGVVILNAGILHRVGPARIHVSLARALARRGFVSLRFDLSGIGDSPRLDASASFLKLAVAEAIEAMNFLASSRGNDRFVIVGICSGADLGLQVAQADTRVAGAVLVDGYNMPTPLFVLLLAKRQLLSPRSWLRFLLGRSQTIKALRATAATQESAETSIIPSHSAFITGLRAIARRGTLVLLLFTGGSPASHHYKRGLGWKLARWSERTAIRVQHLDDTDHTFTLVRNQRRFVSLVEDWLTTEFPLGPAMGGDVSSPSLTTPSERENEAFKSSR